LSRQVSIPIPPYIGTDQILAVSANGVPIALTRLDGAWHAFDDFCPHAGCSFSGSGIIEEGVLICNCHGAEFDLQTGQPLRGIAFEPIAIFPIETGEKQLAITLP